MQRAALLIAGLTSWDGERGVRLHHPLVDGALGRSTNMNITSIEGGANDNQLPERCAFTGMITFPPGETAVAVQAAFETAVRDAARAVPGGLAPSPQ